MEKYFSAMGNFLSSKENKRGSAARFQPERFDVIILTAVGILIAAIGVVILRGDQTGGGVRPASGARIIYMGPAKSVVQNLYVVSTSGGAPVQLTDSRNGIMDFDVFPDGRVVYADQNIDGSTNIMLYEQTTGKSRELFKCTDALCNEVAASPDGRLIAFDRSELNSGTNLAPGAPRVWLYDMTKNETFRLFSDSQKVGYGAVWSPDGSRIALWDSNRGGIVLYDFTTQKESVVPAYGGRVGEFSPDGQKIWLARVVDVAADQNDPNKRQYATHISIADISKEPYRIRDIIPDTAADDDVDPIWSPDGRSLYVLRRPAGATPDQNPQVFQLDIETGKGTPILVDYAYSHSLLELNADASQLLVQRFPMSKAGATPEAWVYDFKTGQARMIVDNGNLPRWLP
jgi:Tol biopolymer transport system component